MGALRVSPDGGGELLWGVDPVAEQDPLLFDTVASEAATGNSYPDAARRLHSLFADSRAPDIAVVHTGRHYWPERGGHLGEHGSLGLLQSRAPLILSGPGIPARGLLRRAARVVDVGPTLGYLAGVALTQLTGLDGTALVDLVSPQAEQVVGLLWDGANANSVYALARAGQLPGVGRLLESGVGLVGGAIAEFPSVTLVNHTSALTGMGPGRHGIVNNSFYDSALGARVVANEAASWHLATGLLRPGVSTVFEWLGSTGARSACVNEPVDRGAHYSTFGLIRDSGQAGGAAGFRSALPDPLLDQHATAQFVAASPDYAWSTQVDAAGLTQMLSLFEEAQTPPKLTWWNTTLTDTGHHEGGPHSPVAHAALADTDRRLVTFLQLLERTGRLSRTAFLLTADHGSQAAAPDCRGDWDEALREAGLAFRDEAYGFIYLGVAGQG